MTCIPECWKDHQPPVDWPETYPKGIAGRTIFYAIVEDPESFGWSATAQDYLAMCAIISTYETWHAARMSEVRSIMEDFETEPMSVPIRTNKSTDLFDKLKAIDERFMGDGDNCWNLVPSEVQDSYIESME